MSDLKYRPPGYINKEEPAAVLGMCTNTFDRLCDWRKEWRVEAVALGRHTRM